MSKYSSVNEVKEAVDSGVEVFVGTLLYKVVKNNSGYFVKCTGNGVMIGLMMADEETCNFNVDDFFSA